MDDSYLLDSNIFIQSHRFEYRFSFCSGFWELLEILHQRGIVFSIRAVKNELLKGNDALSAWIRQLPESFFYDERDQETQSRYGFLMNWAHNNPQFTQNAKMKFASQHADPWLVAYAAAHDMKLITHEVFDQNIKKSIKIPNAERVLNVQCVNMYDFLELFWNGTFTVRP